MVCGVDPGWSTAAPPGGANVGFGGLANAYVSSARVNLAPFACLRGGPKSFLDWRNITFTLEVDGTRCTVSGWLIAGGNVGLYSGGCVSTRRR
ncbi:hypothetical protein GCM10009715_25770 [Paeniglutamicibacter psychrophenolicus]